ncbi:hypothetical protein [Streptomyces sp. JW3]
MLESTLWDVEDGRPPDGARLETGRLLRRTRAVKGGMMHGS